MKKAAELPHRDEEIRRQQANQKTSGKRDISRLKLCCRHNHPQCRAAVSNQIHNRNGIKLHRQYLHGNFAEFFRLAIHFLMFKTVGLIDFKRRKSLQIFQKGIAKRRVLPPIF